MNYDEKDSLLKKTKMTIRGLFHRDERNDSMELKKIDKILDFPRFLWMNHEVKIIGDDDDIKVDFIEKMSLFRFSSCIISHNAGIFIQFFFVMGLASFALLGVCSIIALPFLCVGLKKKKRFLKKYGNIKHNNCIERALKIKFYSIIDEISTLNRKIIDINCESKENNNKLKKFKKSINNNNDFSIKRIINSEIDSLEQKEKDNMSKIEQYQNEIILIQQQFVKDDIFNEYIKKMQEYINNMESKVKTYRNKFINDTDKLNNINISKNLDKDVIKLLKIERETLKDSINYHNNLISEYEGKIKKLYKEMKNYNKFHEALIEYLG